MPCARKCLFCSLLHCKPNAEELRPEHLQVPLSHRVGSACLEPARSVRATYKVRSSDWPCVWLCYAPMTSRPPLLHEEHLGLGAGCCSRSCCLSVCLCSLMPGFYPPRAFLQGACASSGQVQSRQFCQVWTQQQSLCSQITRDPAPGPCLSIPILEIRAGPGWAPAEAQKVLVQGRETAAGSIHRLVCRRDVRPHVHLKAGRSNCPLWACSDLIP